MKDKLSLILRFFNILHTVDINKSVSYESLHILLYLAQAKYLEAYNETLFDNSIFYRLTEIRIEGVKDYGSYDLKDFDGGIQASLNSAELDLLKEVYDLWSSSKWFFPDISGKVELTHICDYVKGAYNV